LPKAWSGFLAGNDRGASCLGPHSGLKMQEVLFKAALDAFSDPQKTTVVLVMRPDTGAIAEASRTSEELHALGLHNQRMVVNGVFHASNPHDPIACAIEKLGRRHWPRCHRTCWRLRKTKLRCGHLIRWVCRHCAHCSWKRSRTMLQTSRRLRRQRSTVLG
jgi:anion-transporting  ArsA/GET3 family ATPase